MVEGSKWMSDFRNVTKAEPTLEDNDAIEQELYSLGNDRALAVMMAALVEANLQRLIETKLKPDLRKKDQKALFGLAGPFGSFSLKIASAHGLGLIGPIVKSDLDLIRALRNGFAHSRVSLSFQTPEVKPVCDKLKIPDMPGSFIPPQYLERLNTRERTHAESADYSKSRFVSSCHNISYRMFKARIGFLPGDLSFGGEPLLP